MISSLKDSKSTIAEFEYWLRTVSRTIERILRCVTVAALILGPFSSAQADLRTAPVWYDQNAVTVTPDWHYRVPIEVPASATVNSTIKVDVNFAALLATLGVSGTFDVNSPRVVRSGGALATVQEYTDSVFGGVTDATGNARGEIRFLLQDAGPASYALYFDITQNGTKPANPQAPINGNFERGGTGAATPTGWNAATVTAGVDGQIRPPETVSVTANPAAVDGVQTRNTDGNPNTGGFSYLLGNRTTATGGIAGAPGLTLTRTFTVPATGAGNVTVRWRPEGWDTGDFDPVRIDLINAAGTVLTEIVGPTAGNYGTKPFAPNTNNAQASATVSGFRQYNGFDCNLSGAHTLIPPMTVACKSEPWFAANQSLAAYAGQTVRVRIRYFSDNADKTWYHIDDFEWSVVSATLGIPQGFGVNVTAPAASSTFTPGQAIPVTAQVDANPTASTTPVTAALFDSGGTQIAAGFILFNDGTHGDAVAGDAIWSNTNSIPAQPAPTVPLSATTGTGYILRVFARDGSTSTIGAQNGLIRGPGTGAAAESQANFWTIDEILFNVQAALVSLAKTNTVVDDPVNGASNPKMIPGARVRYCLLVTNAGPATASNIVMTDTIPITTTYIPGTLRSGTTCATATTAEDDDNVAADESDPVGASFSAGTIITITSTVITGGTVALTFEVTIN